MDDKVRGDFNSSRLEDFRIAQKHFGEKLRLYGEEVKALSWGSEYSQQARFEVLAEIGNLSDKSILDIGCGFGDFYGFLRSKKIVLTKYLGIDINGEMLKVAKKKYPEVEFLVLNILSENAKKELGKLDYVIASGIFSLDSPTWDQYVRRMLKAMYLAANEAVGVNFLSAYTTGNKFRGSRYCCLSDILGFVAKELTTKFIIRHDYLPNDFTLLLYKRQGSHE